MHMYMTCTRARTVPHSPPTALAATTIDIISGGRDKSSARDHDGRVGLECGARTAAAPPLHLKE